MSRREFITLVGATVAWPLAARTQQPQRMRRMGVLMPFAADDPESMARISVLLQRLQELGWSVGRNLMVDYRWTADATRIRQYAQELVALTPDVLVCNGNPTVRPLQEASRTIPIVFASVADPVAAGYVQSLARPGGNITGFINFEYTTSGKWLELLKEIEPRLTRAAILRNSSDVGQFAVVQAMAAIQHIELIPIDSDREIEQPITAFAHQENGGMIVVATAANIVHRDLIISLASRYRLPAIYPFRFFSEAGGLASYGPYPVDQYRGVADYVDRILKGENPADRPVQAPSKYQLVINLKTAKALGLTVPPTLLARADEVIE
jgi:putative ABC transport system substrate-binding protein